jgi:membrane protease YdiL (CAAX protease family)
LTTILAAAGTGVVVLLAGNLLWAGLGAWNLRHGIAVPWAVVPTALCLWVYWRFIGGRWGPLESRADRQAKLRANRLPARVWCASLAAGLLGFATLIAWLVVAARLVRLPSGPPITTPLEMPIATAVSLLVMQSIVAGVSEEAAFRGYMQSMIEPRYGLTVAILANGTLFGLLHFSSHPADVLLMLPYYVAVSAVYGGLTWAADSILPALVLHSAGDVVVLTRWWLTGRPEWQIGATTPAPVWERGLDGPFVLSAVASVVLAVLTVRAYGALRRSRMAAFATPPPSEGVFTGVGESRERVHP